MSEQKIDSFLPFDTPRANHIHGHRTLSSNAEGEGTDWYKRRCGTSISFTYVLAQVKEPTINEIKDSSCYMLEAIYHE